MRDIDIKSPSINVVVDASVILAYIVPDELLEESLTIVIQQGLRSERLLTAPHILKFEVPNGLKSMILRKRTTVKQATAIVKKFNELPIIYNEVDINAVFACSQKENVSCYDASYLILARSLSVPLLTLDKRLGTLV